MAYNPGVNRLLNSINPGDLLLTCRHFAAAGHKPCDVLRVGGSHLAQAHCLPDLHGSPEQERNVLHVTLPQKVVRLHPHLARLYPHTEPGTCYP
eukprot:1160387-Pelagomonas_calceolata.AAC.9